MVVHSCASEANAIADQAAIAPAVLARLVIELLGKYQKLFTKRHELLRLPEQYDFSELDDEQLTTFRDCC